MEPVDNSLRIIISILFSVVILLSVSLSLMGFILVLWETCEQEYPHRHSDRHYSNTFSGSISLKYNHGHNLNDINGRLSIIGSSEYICSGSCFCTHEEDEIKVERRLGIVNSLSKRLFSIVSATTVLIAIRKATKEFQHKCQSEMNDECPSDSVISSIDDCIIRDDNQEETQESSEVHSEIDGKVKFLCDGSCSPISLHTRYGHITMEHHRNECQEEFERGERESELMGGIDMGYEYDYMYMDLYDVMDEISNTMTGFCDDLCIEKSPVYVDSSLRLALQEERAIAGFQVRLLKFCKANSFRSFDNIIDTVIKNNRYYQDGPENDQSRVDQLKKILKDVMTCSNSYPEIGLCKGSRVDQTLPLSKRTPKIRCERTFSVEEIEKGVDKKFKKESERLVKWKREFTHYIDPTKEYTPDRGSMMKPNKKKS